MTRLLAALAALAALATLLPAAAAADAPALVLVEAESFARRGGWVVDPQFMDQMGSPYLLAHGLGRPVPDAATEVTLPAPGRYRVWVRTLDWVARWKAPGAPGRFQVLLDGRPLGTTFGTAGADWHWQDGGTVTLPAPRVRLALHDLTGFEGRCDAVLFARDEGFTPPNRDPEMARFRRACLGLPERPEAAGEFDFVVTGGGIAGTCAALAAARQGVKVALVQDRPVLGGNNSSEVRVWLQGARNKEPWPRIGDVVAELEQRKSAHYGPANTAELYEDGRKLALVRAEPNIRLFLEHRVNAAETAGGKVVAVVAQEIPTGRRVRLAGRWFADCTGDAAVGALAGADFEMEPKGHMGPCNLWNVCECRDTTALGTGVAPAPVPQPFPRCPWALDLSGKPFPGRSKTHPDTNKLGSWEWESGFDRDPIAEMEVIRDWNFRAMYGAWDAMKNVDKVLPNHRLNWAAHILGKRESRRLLGDVVLAYDDLVKDRVFPDGCVPTGWSNDLHAPDPRYAKGFEGDAFIARAHFGEFPAHREGRPYWIPYRCLYSRNVANLFMAGRDISVRHDALGAVRVMRTGGCMGEVVGLAVSLCRTHDTLPRAVYERHLGELQTLMRRGAGKGFPAPRPAPAADKPAAQAPRRPMLLAAYYCWYHTGAHPTRPWLHWTYPGSRNNALARQDQRPGEPPPASAARPLIGPYDSADPAVARWHVQLAKAAGLDAFLVDWWDTHNALDQNVDKGIVTACAKERFPFALLDERAQFHGKLDDYQAMLVRALKRYKDHPCYLKIDDKPLVYLYQVAAKPGLTPDDFSSLRRHVEAAVGPVYWVVDKIAHDHQAQKAGDEDRVKRIPADWLNTPGIDAFAFYSTFSNFRAHRHEDLVGKYRYLAKLAHDAGKKMMLPVHPGHDNSRFRDDPYVMPRRDGQTLRDYLRAATDAGADYILVTSWNEWPETTVVEPSSSWPDPYLYLKVLAEWQGRPFTAPPLPARLPAPAP